MLGEMQSIMVMKASLQTWGRPCVCSQEAESVGMCCAMRPNPVTSFVKVKLHLLTDFIDFLSSSTSQESHVLMPALVGLSCTQTTALFTSPGLSQCPGIVHTNVYLQNCCQIQLWKCGNREETSVHNSVGKILLLMGPEEKSEMLICLYLLM